jgi:hypothetical protein
MTSKIVAKFSVFESCLFVILFLALLIDVSHLAYIEVYPPGATALSYEWPTLRWHPGVILPILLSPFIVFGQLRFLWQLAFGKRAAAWLDGEHLVLFNWFPVIPLKKFLCTRIVLKDIDHFSVIPAKTFISSSVVVHLKTGERKYLSTFLLVDNAATLVPRLSAALA